MEFLELLLSPLTWVMGLLLNAGVSITGSAGASILLLSLLASLALYPLQRWAHGIEAAFLKKHCSVNHDLNLIESSLRGEAKFHAQDEVFQKHSYHPIQQIFLSMSVMLSLPVLIAAIFLFDNNTVLQGVKFGFIRDLSTPDQLAFGYNLMPILLFTITLVDAITRFKTNRATLNRFLLISVVLFILVYSLPAALILFWIGNNIVSMLVYNFRKAQQQPIN